MNLLTNTLHTLRGKLDGQLARRLPLRTLLSGILLIFSLRLILVKRRTTGRRSKYISNLERVGKRVVDGKALNPEDASEYDIVIIGGGKFVPCHALPFYAPWLAYDQEPLVACSQHVCQRTPIFVSSCWSLVGGIRSQFNL